MINNKVMVEVGDLEKLKKAIKKVSNTSLGDLASIGLAYSVPELVDLAKRVVAAEEKVLAAIAAPSDYNKY
jgi:hypothetical protein